MTDPPPTVPVVFLHLPLPASSFFWGGFFFFCSSVSRRSRHSSFCLQAPVSSSPLTSVSPPVHAFCLSSHPPCFFFFFASSWVFTSCRPHHPFWLGVCWEDLLLSLAFYLFPHLLFPLKVKLKSPAPTQANVRAHTGVSLHTRVGWQNNAAPRHMKERKTSCPTFALPSSHPSAPLTPSLSVLASTFLCLLFSCCSAVGDGVIHVFALALPFCFTSSFAAE